MATTARCSLVNTRPAARPSATMNSAVIGGSPARPRMPSVPKYFFCVMGKRDRRRVRASLHRIRGAIGAEDAGENRFDLGACGFPIGGVVELHTDAGGAVALCTGGGGA